MWESPESQFPVCIFSRYLSPFTSYRQYTNVCMPLFHVPIEQPLKRHCPLPWEPPPREPPLPPPWNPPPRRTQRDATWEQRIHMASTFGQSQSASQPARQ